jgi:hypothetical protein
LTETTISALVFLKKTNILRLQEVHNGSENVVRAVAPSIPGANIIHLIEITRRSDTSEVNFAP